MSYRSKRLSKRGAAKAKRKVARRENVGYTLELKTPNKPKGINLSEEKPIDTVEAATQQLNENNDETTIDSDDRDYGPMPALDGDEDEDEEDEDEDSHPPNVPKPQ